MGHFALILTVVGLVVSIALVFAQLRIFAIHAEVVRIRKAIEQSRAAAAGVKPPPPMPGGSARRA